MPQANGSCVLKCGGTRVLAGVKVELDIPEVQGRGLISCSVNCSMIASAMFEGRAGEDISAELSREQRCLPAPVAFLPTEALHPSFHPYPYADACSHHHTEQLTCNCTHGKNSNMCTRIRRQQQQHSTATATATAKGTAKGTAKRFHTVSARTPILMPARLAAGSVSQIMNGMPASVYESLAVGQQGRQCWHLHVDATVLDYDGSLLDSCTMGENPGYRALDSDEDM